jgi:hypothetical protein
VNNNGGTAPRLSELKYASACGCSNLSAGNGLASTGALGGMAAL